MKYAVIGVSEIDGTFIDSFESLEEAEKFALRIIYQGFTAHIMSAIRRLDMADEPLDTLDDYYGVHAGQDYPSTLNKPQGRAA